MPLHMTKVAYGAQSLAEIHEWFSDTGRRGGAKVAYLTTRNRPKRAEEMIGGSLYWIHKHQLVARSEIVGFEEAEGGRTNIVVSTRLIDVHPKPRRAHQGWRYLEEADAPADLGDGEAGEVLPAQIASELAKLGLV
ncbi:MULTISPECIES: DUF1489 domain-containing protein [Novosphingobium]|jgi:hypothetical protein|uniref:DUF1489 domain-containing protein n=1 Tax=Novosphingobium subterraneum TaxID=48936 RepID=A0A0B8ZPR2_9SPHN|nr:MULTISPECIES: DUF1489 domain-containing protein [Novosphingobium]KHS48171.1 hypothetical protein NJ75_01360 [Novosphingobium subterraneum]QOV94544.1 DUF1489 domain-containing protein [Novosphingobium sp. ES2-1]